MKNNKGLYSWIHSLNEAAIQSHVKGIEMLKEEKARKITDPQRQAALFAQMQPPAPTTMQGDDVLPIYDEKGRRAEAVREKSAKRAYAAEIIDKQLSKVPGYEVNPESITRGRGDPIVYAEIQKMKDAESLAKLASFDGPIDAAPAGDADDVEDDAEDGTMADPGIGIADPSSRLPTYPLAAEARAEHAKESYKEASRAARIAARQAAAEQDYEEREDARFWSGPSGRTGETYTESVNKIINKLLNEEDDPDSGVPTTRGQIGIGGDEKIFPMGSYPVSIFRKLGGDQTAASRIRHLIHIVSNPEQHSDEHYNYADKVLRAMASHLNNTNK